MAPENGSAAALDGFVRLLATEVARAVVAELRSGQVGMVDQSASPLGRRRHIGAVRRRVAAGQAGAAVVGRRHLLTPDAVAAELAACKPRPPKQQAVDELEPLRQRYALRKVGT